MVEEGAEVCSRGKEGAATAFVDAGGSSRSQRCARAPGAALASALAAAVAATAAAAPRSDGKGRRVQIHAAAADADVGMAKPGLGSQARGGAGITPTGSDKVAVMGGGKALAEALAAGDAAGQPLLQPDSATATTIDREGGGGEGGQEQAEAAYVQEGDTGEVGVGVGATSLKVGSGVKRRGGSGGGVGGLFGAAMRDLKRPKQ